LPAKPSIVDGSTDRRVDKLLALLSENPVIVLSGAKIAKEIGVTRSTVWRWIEKLRGLGVKLKGHPRTGYQLEKVPDILASQILRQRLAGTLFAKRIHHFFQVDSTNNVAMRLGQEGEAHGAVVVAEEQTAGRGRVGNTWHSEKTTGIYLSVLLRPAIPPQQAPLLTLLAGLAVRDAVGEQTGLAADIRWPNDLLLGGKKFCGILTEMHAEPHLVRFVVIGIGINVNNAKLPDALAATATSLRIESGRQISRLELTVKLLRALERDYNQFLAPGGPAALLARFTRASMWASGKRVRVAAPAGAFTGVTAGLEPSGLLRVTRDDTGDTEVVIAGEVREA
jgi:BirA family biotin operon repressor/biotin-[acetyl-CoA-carboxylase] ligase